MSITQNINKENLNSLLFEEILSKSLTLNTSGLLQGHAGILLSILYSSENISLTEEQINQTEQLATIVLNNVANPHSDSSYSEGLSGILWSLNNLKNNQLIEIETETFSFYSDYLNDQLLIFANNNLFDNLHGAFGILNYLIDSKTLKTDTFDSFIELFKQQIYQNEKICLVKEIFAKGPEFKAYNFGLSHGLSGKLLILLKAFQFYPSQKLKHLITELTNFLYGFLNTQNESSNEALFPTLLDDLTQVQYGKIRLAWCYGDIGPCLALYKYSLLFNDITLRNHLRKLLIKLAQRKGLRANYVLDAPLCHGAAGLAHIFNKLYIETRQTEFLKASDYWESEIHNFYFQKNDLNSLGTHTTDTGEFRFCTSLLEGLSGILLALNTKKTNNFNWEGSLFLN